MDVERSCSITPPPQPGPAWRLPDRIRLPLSFDASRLREDLASLAGAEWTPHFVPQHYEGEWSALPLRAPAGATHPILRIAGNPGTAAWEWTQWLDGSPYLSEVLGSFKCEIHGVRLMRLAPGAIIREHCDDRLAAEWGQARLHVPIVTDDAVDFRLNGVRVRMGPGETWYLRFSDPHSVANRGRCERIHLVIDTVVNEWLDALLYCGARATARGSGQDPGAARFR